ncbi:hypothetical protein QZH41_003872 [Actinostola sp. cb2023]|nr:hypothetical protein QZH41_003872 [Actinostola sp. cb2023]
MAERTDSDFDFDAEFGDSGDENSFDGFEIEEEDAGEVQDDSDVDFGGLESDEDRVSSPESEAEDEERVEEDEEWTNQLNDFRTPDFVLPSEMSIPLPAEPKEVDIFSAFVGDDLIDLMVAETNHYARQRLSTLPRRLEKFTDVTREEMRAYIGINIIMGMEYCMGETIDGYVVEIDVRSRGIFVKNALMALKRRHSIESNSGKNNSPQDSRIVNCSSCEGQSRGDKVTKFNIDNTTTITLSVLDRAGVLKKCARIQMYRRNEYLVSADNQSAVTIKSTGELLHPKYYYTNELQFSDEKDLPSKDDKVLSILTLLRTPPGINLMNLSISILLAQLLWILGSGQTDTPIACTVIAVLLHYFFLVSFVWTSIIAFDTWRAFTAKGRRSLADSKRNRLMHCLRYLAVGWLSVMVYVAICIAIDQSDTVFIGYGSRDTCWIADNKAKLYFFAIPAGLIMVFNIVFYSMTVKAIRDTRSQTSLITAQSDKKHHAGVYMRIGSLMGFTWIFGFAAPFGWLFLSYVFVVLNSLQGVYTVIAFVLSARARKLYNEAIRGKKSSIRKGKQGSKD